MNDPVVYEIPEGPRSSSRKTLWIVLGVVGGSVLLTVLGCAGLITWGMGMFREIGVVQTAANEFLDEIAAGRIDEARDLAAPPFREKVDADTFRAWVKKYPALTTQTSRTMTGCRIYATPAGTRGTVQFQLAGGNNSVLATLILVKSSDRWRVESLNLP